jgi:hypothetical protein
VQRSRHGGTLLIAPSSRADEFMRDNPWIKLKYKFQEEEPRARFRSLLIRAMDALAAVGGRFHGVERRVGWEEYGRAAAREFDDIDEAIFEMSHLLATLTGVDGAVLLTQRFELLGFGGEISGALAETTFVAKALDLEGMTCAIEPTENVGTRHRSVYRLCNALRDMLGIVVSQDGSARFVRWKDPQVMYWNHSAVTTPMFG